MKNVWIIFCLLCSCMLCKAQPTPRWGRLSTGMALYHIEGLAYGYFFCYCQYPETIDDLIKHAQYILTESEESRETWKEIVWILKRDKSHMNVRIDKGISYYQGYTDPIDSLEHSRPVEGPVFYIFYDNDTILSIPVDGNPEPCGLVSDTEIYIMDYVTHCHRFGWPHFYEASGQIVFTSEKIKENFEKKIQRLKKKYLTRTEDAELPYPSYYYVYEGMFVDGIQKVPIRRFVEYQDNILRDYCTGEDITHESLYNEKLTAFLRKYAKKHKYSKIRYMTIHFNPDGKNVRVKKEDFNRIIWKQN